MNHVLKDNVKQVVVTLYINVVLIECLYKHCLFEIELKRSHNSSNSKPESPSYEYDLMISYLRKKNYYLLALTDSIPRLEIDAGFKFYIKDRYI